MNDSEPGRTHNATNSINPVDQCRHEAEAVRLQIEAAIANALSSLKDDTNLGKNALGISRDRLYRALPHLEQALRAVDGWDEGGDARQFAEKQDPLK